MRTRRPRLTRNVRLLSGVSFLQDAASELLYPGGIFAITVAVPALRRR
ncbi:hypothetical protein [Mycolicibacterium baixiangningiae]|nr:hypothetical protein [Mycolicibacterium baixiangningiae]